MRRYVAMLALVCGERWTAARLVTAAAGDVRGGDAPEFSRRLARLAGWSELRTGARIAPLPDSGADAVGLSRAASRCERWRARARPARARLDRRARASRRAGDAGDGPRRRARPGPVRGSIRRVDALRATALGHPLMPDDRRVANDVERRAARHAPADHRIEHVGQEHAAARDRAERRARAGRRAGLRGGVRDAAGAISTRASACEDSLELGLSYFMAALARLKQIVDARRADGAGTAPVLLYLLDEVLQGTNSVERGIAVRAVVRHLLDARRDRRDDDARPGAGATRSRSSRPRGSRTSPSRSTPTAR